MFSNLKKKLLQHVAKIPGWRTGRKLVVIESDDWGAVRMPSKNVYQKMLDAGFPVDTYHYSKYDTLASAEDLTLLFDVLSNFKDSNGNHPVITANAIMTNPDFEKIKKNNFNEYYWEPFTETLRRYDNSSRSFDLWRQGMDEKIFYPQFHGREHVNVGRWLECLQSGSNQAIRTAFDHEFYNLSEVENSISSNFFMDALNFQSDAEKEQIRTRLIEGLQLFESIFGYKSESFIAPCYIWASDIEKTLFEYGIDVIQGVLYQKEPVGNDYKKFRRKYHYTGERNLLGQRYTVRNVFFEPSSRTNINWVDSALHEMEIAFTWRKPAIICAHRVNFVGRIDPGNSVRSAKLLKQLLDTALLKWPDIEFVNSVQLGKLMNE